MMRSGIKWLKNPFTVMSAKCAHYGLSFPLQLPQIGQVLVTGDPAHIKTIATRNEFNAGEGIRALSHFLGNRSVICLDGKLHQARHALLSKYLYSDKIFLLDETLRNFCQQQLLLIKKKSIFNFYQFSQHVLLDIAILQLLGNIAPDDYLALKSAIQGVYSLNIHPTILFIKPLQFKCFGWSAWGRLMKYQQQIRITLGNILRNNCADSHSLLYYLISQNKNYYSHEEELIDEIMALLFFAHETTAATIATVADFIIGHPAVIEKIKNDKNYLHACIKEGMRLKPVVPHLSRISRASQQLNDFFLKENQWVFPSSYLAHHNELVFPQHHKFIPERFLPAKDYPYNCFPFGIGDRICLGKKLANRHMEIILMEIFTTLQFEPASAKPLGPSRRQLVLMVPSNLAVARVVANKALKSSA